MLKYQHRFIKLHWRLFFPLIGLVWLIIGIAIGYFVMHERQRQRDNLENRLLNVNNTVIDAYERGVDLGKTVDFIRLFTDNTTLAPLRITVYDNAGNMVADNPAETIRLHDESGNRNEVLTALLKDDHNGDVVYDSDNSMVSCRRSDDGKIITFAALPYEGAVIDFLRIDPMVWLVVILLGIISSVLAYLSIRTICQNVYSLRDYAEAIASDNLPDNIESMKFSKDELGDVSRNLLTLYRDKMHAEQEKMHHERQIVLNVSHELKTPVGIIKGYIDTVLADPDMPGGMKQKFLLRAKQNADRLAEVINDVTAVMRLQENGGEIELTPIDFRQLVDRITEDVVQGHVADNFTLEYDLPDPCMVMGHESLLINALLNLIYNASQHSEGDTIRLTGVKEPDGIYRFTFVDNGRGVEEKHLSRLFDLFYRVDFGRSRKTGGSGLGLPLVSRILKAMGGDIEVANSDEGGLEFTFTLRAAD